jgi:hypothetical protein
MDSPDIPVGSLWCRQQNQHPMRVLAVVEGYVMYRYQKHHPGVVSVGEWLSSFRRVGRQSATTPPPVARVRRTR